MPLLKCKSPGLWEGRGEYFVPELLQVFALTGGFQESPGMVGLTWSELLHREGL